MLHICALNNTDFVSWSVWRLCWIKLIDTLVKLLSLREPQDPVNPAAKSACASFGDAAGT